MFSHRRTTFVDQMEYKATENHMYSRPTPTDDGTDQHRFFLCGFTVEGSDDFISISWPHLIKNPSACTVCAKLIETPQDRKRWLNTYPPSRFLLICINCCTFKIISVLWKSNGTSSLKKSILIQGCNAEKQDKQNKM